MKHTLIYRATLLALMAAATTACSNEITDAEGGNPTGNGDGGKMITVTATQQAGEANGQQQGDQPQTRLAYDFSNAGSVTVTWKTGDKFYVGNDASWTANNTNLSASASKFKPFTLQSNGGTKTESFSGTIPDGTTDKAQFYALYGRGDQMKTTSEQTITLNYYNQQQSANDNNDHLADYDFMAATATYQAGETTAFNFTHQGAMMKFTITMPAADMTVKELRLAAIDLSTDDTALNPFSTTCKWKVASNTLESSGTESTASNINLKLGGDNGLAISGKTLTAYMMVAPTTLTKQSCSIVGKEIMLLVTAVDDKIYSATLTGAEINQGHYYTVTAALSNSSIFEGGNGTKETPYEIHDAGQLRNMAKLINSGIVNANGRGFLSAHFKLTDDINLTGKEWTPISPSSPFEGSLTGAKDDESNYKITNLSIKGDYSSSSYLHFGLFGQLYGNVSNVTVSGEISPTIKSANKVRVGGIAGNSTGTTPATNCISNCTINITNSPSDVYAGGIIGYTGSQTTTLTNCSNTGAITLSTSSPKKLYAGGIIGYLNFSASPLTLTLNGYSNTGIPAVIGHYDFTLNDQSKIEIRQTLDGTPVVLKGGSGSYPLSTSGGAGQYPDDGDMFGIGTN